MIIAKKLIAIQQYALRFNCESKEMRNCVKVFANPRANLRLDRTWKIMHLDEYGNRGTCSSE